MTMATSSYTDILQLKIFQNWIQHPSNSKCTIEWDKNKSFGIGWQLSVVRNYIQSESSDTNIINILKLNNLGRWMELWLVLIMDASSQQQQLSYA